MRDGRPDLLPPVAHVLTDTSDKEYLCPSGSWSRSTPNSRAPKVVQAYLGTAHA